MGAPAGGFDTSKVWSPAGGWFADPKHWKRNTAMGFGVLAVASAMIFNTTAASSRRGRCRPRDGYPHRRGAKTSPRMLRKNEIITGGRFRRR